MSLLKKVSLVRISSTDNGSYVKGRWVESRNTTFPFKGTWQPARGRVLELLPTGKRNKETYICYAPISMDFTSADPESGKSGDLIMWENKVYEVVIASKWANSLINHWELVCVRKKEGTKVDFSVANSDKINGKEEVDYAD